MTRYAHGVGLATLTHTQEILDTWFPHPQLGRADNSKAEAERLLAELKTAACPDAARQITREVISVEIDLEAAPQTVPDAYLRLHLLSHRLVTPNSINLEGIFGVLPNVVWTNFGPCSPTNFEATRLRLMNQTGSCVQVRAVDKFPPLIDYYLPPGVRLGDGVRVRLGAYLSPGTTVMHAGFVNFNAGTLGASMVEGRISQGVVVGDGTDIGGGASTMGTLSGGGTQRVYLGKRCLLGANSGVGIALGDDCVVEAGLYVTAGTKVSLADSLPAEATPDGKTDLPALEKGQTVAARLLSGRSKMLFIRHSVTGQVQVRFRFGVGIELNEELHSN